MAILRFFYSVSRALGNLSKLVFMNNYSAGKNFSLFLGGGIIGDKTAIHIGDNVELHGWLISDGGRITIGDNTVVHHGAVIRSMESVEIGSYCDIGNDVYVQDHNSMSLDHLERREKNPKKAAILHKPIKLGNDVWIGRRAMILKGVRLQDKSIVGAGAVVTKGAGAPGLFVGNPAKNVRALG